MKAKGLIAIAMLAMLMGCAGMRGETSGSSGGSAGMSSGTGYDPYPRDDIFHSYIN